MGLWKRMRGLVKLGVIASLAVLKLFLTMLLLLGRPCVLVEGTITLTTLLAL